MAGGPWLPDSILKVIKSDLASVVRDTNMGAKNIVYRWTASLDAGGSATVNVKTGAVTDPFASVSLTCIVGVPTDVDAKQAGTDLQATDRRFLIDRADLGHDPAADDVIVYNGTVYGIINTKIHEATGLIAIYGRSAGGEK